VKYAGYARKISLFQSGGPKMFKLFWKTGTTVARAGRDALDHPQLRNMTPDELADLPLTPDWPYADLAVSRSPQAQCR
jgi:hypothetical protein